MQLNPIPFGRKIVRRFTKFVLSIGSEGIVLMGEKPDGEFGPLQADENGKIIVVAPDGGDFLEVDPITGAITGPVTADQFKTSNAIVSEAEFSYISNAQFQSLLKSNIYYQADRKIEACKFSCTGSSPLAAGTYLWAPSAGSPYSFNSYVRDTAMMMRSLPGKFLAQDVLNQIILAAAIQNGGTGAIPDGVTQNQVAITNTYPTSTDNCFEFIDLIYTHYKKTGITSAYTTYLANITLALSYPTITNHLVFITQNATLNSQQGDWGFQDQIASSGYSAMLSIERYRAYTQLSEMALAAGDSTGSTTYSTEAGLIKTNLQTQLWDATRGLFRNASIDDTAHSVVASAYAVVTGACTDAVSNIISQKLLDMRIGQVDAADCPYQQGYVRHLPLTETWDRLRVAQTVGTYQNGGYWSTFTGWVAIAMARLDSVAAVTLLNDFYTSTPGVAGNRPYEAINTTIAYLGAANYGPSAAQPYGYYTDVFDTVISRLFLLNQANQTSSIIQGPEFRGYNPNSADGDLILSVQGNGAIVLTNTAGDRWLHTNDINSKGGMILDNHQADAPNVSWYTAANTNMSLDADGTGLRILRNASESGATLQATFLRTGVFRNGAGIESVENLDAITSGFTLRVKTGTNAKSGTFTLAAGAATIANTNWTANSVVIMTLKTLGGTILAQPYVATVTPATGFTVAGGGASNTSTYNYVIVEVLP